MQRANMEEDYYEDDYYEDAQLQFDLDLLLSVAGGLGRHLDGDNGRRHYEKDEDCVGESNGPGERRGPARAEGRSAAPERSACARAKRARRATPAAAFEARARAFTSLRPLLPALSHRSLPQGPAALPAP